MQDARDKLAIGRIGKHAPAVIVLYGLGQCAVLERVGGDCVVKW